MDTVHKLSVLVKVDLFQLDTSRMQFVLLGFDSDQQGIWYIVAVLFLLDSVLVGKLNMLPVLTVTDVSPVDTWHMLFVQLCSDIAQQGIEYRPSVLFHSDNDQLGT